MAKFFGSTANDTYVGTTTSDAIFGSGGNDNLDGAGGNDQIYGGDGNDTLYGGSGDDILAGDTLSPSSPEVGSNIVYGGDGNDQIYTGVLGDTMYGENGDDTFIVQGTSGAAIFDGGSGFDSILIQDFNGFNPASSGRAVLYVDSINSIEQIANVSGRGADIINLSGDLNLSGTTLINITQIRGGNDADNITGNIILDSSTRTYRGAIIQGFGGNDTITGSQLNDTLTGDDGNDTVSGGAGDDFVSGGNGQDILIGGLGVDQLFGGAGNDTLAGQGGNDQLTGDAGADLFYFNLSGGQDTITDFQNGIDKIGVGGDITSIKVFEFQGSAALELTSGSTATATYVRLLGVSVSQIDGSDFVFG
ncbi:calcium-binding protein [Aureimonas pseudogalii]|uniref:Ca2+-binding RTX toxin-like protein n=1 Tax=Aureimonas pseudogalii TaxID=1744844 RepID=A0A7W6H7Z0_9HYPH|nr:calcium-binding protein [Aureimonas pseudogalii]MBB4000157.1 Ca2+-binding RTX toxin-like protein [Aureimonas pseudogalii]